ncbi:MAG: translation initiation factor IF-6 [Candidatus Micrarchaeota archaeon]
MTLEHRKAAYYGNPFIGIFAATNNSHTIFPEGASANFVHRVCGALGTRGVVCGMGGSSLNGIYAAMNSRGIVMPRFDGALMGKLRVETGLEVYASGEKLNAHGNNIAVNDRGGIISVHVHAAERRRMEECLGVELVPMHIGGYATVGSLCVATNRGFLVHYGANEEEVGELERIFRVKGAKGTANMGTGFVSVCMLANDRGYVAGEGTSAFEMGRAEEALGFLG